MRNISHQISRSTMLSLAVSLILFDPSTSFVFAQDKDAAVKQESNSPSVIEISDTPKSIDPAILYPAALTKKVTVYFKGEQFKKVMSWLQQESKLNVNVDYKALASVKLIETDPVYEKLDDAPLYIFLNRLEMLGAEWYLDGNALHITSRNESVNHDSTVSHNLGDLFDSGFVPQDLLRTLSLFVSGSSVAPRTDNENNRMYLIGDMLFVRSPHKSQQELVGLLAAIRNHGRRTFTNDSPQNDLLRQSLTKIITVDFQDSSLSNVIKELSRLAEVPFRLDRQGLNSTSDRYPISLKATEQKLSTILGSIQTIAGLGWYVRDDAIWIGSDVSSQLVQKTAVYDVRDLCRNREESESLKEMIQKQSRAAWRSGENTLGLMEIPKPGVLIVRHAEVALDEVLELLESYRAALRVSKLRTFGQPAPDPQQVVTGYYRLPHPMAVDLKELLPALIESGTWKSKESPNAVGEIRVISYDSKGSLIDAETENGLVKVQASENVVLMIKQTRFAHQEIGKLISKLLESKSIDSEATLDTTKKPKKTTVNFGSSLIPAESK